MARRKYNVWSESEMERSRKETKKRKKVKTGREGGIEGEEGIGLAFYNSR